MTERSGRRRPQQDKIADFFRSTIPAYMRGDLEKLPNHFEIAHELGVHKSTISTVYNSPEIKKLREGMKPRDRRHPKTRDIIVYYKEEIERLKRGEIKRLSFRKTIAKKFEVNVDTVSAIFNGPEIQKLRETMPPSLPPVVVYVQRQLEEIASGERSNVSSYSSIAREFDMSSSRVGQLIKAHGLRERVAAARKAAEEEASKETVFRERIEDAWFLGAMFGKGALLKPHTKETGLIFTSDTQEVLEAFKNAGEFILGRRGLERNPSDRANRSIIFNHTGYAQLLAPFSVASRVDLLLGKTYAWLERPELNQSFLSGVFDALGRVYFPADTSKGRGIHFSTTDEKVADFLFSRLKLLGVKRPRIIYQGKNNTQPKKVFFSSVFDLKIFASNIQSVSSEKQSVLNRINEYVPKDQEIRMYFGNNPQQIFPEP